MGLEALLARMESRTVTPVTPELRPDVTPKPLPIRACTPVTSVTALNATDPMCGVEGNAANEIPNHECFDRELREEQAAIRERDGGHSPGDEPLHHADRRIEKMVAKLAGDCDLRYAIDTHLDADPEAVILTVAIRDKGACEVRIPKSRYDAFRLLQVIEEHTTRETLQ